MSPKGFLNLVQPFTQLYLAYKSIFTGKELDYTKDVNKGRIFWPELVGPLLRLLFFLQ